MRSSILIVAALGILILLFLATGLIATPSFLASSSVGAALQQMAENAQIRIIEETATAEETGNSAFWLNSGGWMEIEENTIRTAQGNAPSFSYWRILYRFANPLDTDNGYHPQNIFRLVTHSAFVNSEQQAYVKINTIHQSASPNRNESNGILFMSRYQDDDNLYYAGIRVDGYAVIKRKQSGVYETLALAPAFLDDATPYDRELHPNLIPEDAWIGLKFITKERADGSTELALYREVKGIWVPLVQARDSKTSLLSLSNKTHNGLRADFMDAEFRGYLAKELAEI